MKLSFSTLACPEYSFSDIYAMRVTEGEMGDFVQQNHKNIIDIMRNMARTMMVIISRES